MGFWSSLLGVGAAHVIRDMEQDKKDTQKWNDLFYEISKYEMSFNNYMGSIGVKATYTFDVEYVNNGNILPEKRKMDIYKKKVDEYIALGGDGNILFDLEDIDEFTEKMKYLRDIGQLKRQYEFINDDKYIIQSKIENEKKEAERQQDFLSEEQVIYHNQDINHIPGSVFLEVFLLYDYGEYNKYMDMVKEDAGDIRSRCKVIEILKQKIDCCIYEGSTSQSDIYCAIEILEEKLQPIINSNKSYSSNKKLRYIYYMSLLIEAECALWKGDFTMALANYSRVMSEWSDFTNGNHDVNNVNVVLTMCTILNILNLPKCVDKLRLRYNDLIQSQIRFVLGDIDNYKNYHEKLIDKYGIHDVISSFLWDMSGDSVLYDLSIDNWGDINFSSGTCHINIDSDKDCIYFWIMDSRKKEKKGTNLVYGLSEKIEQNKESVEILF